MIEIQSSFKNRLQSFKQGVFLPSALCIRQLYKTMIKMKLSCLLRKGLSLLRLLSILPCLRFILFADVPLRQVDKYSKTEMKLSFKIMSLSFKLFGFCAVALGPVAYDPTIRHGLNKTMIQMQNTCKTRPQ